MPRLPPYYLSDQAGFWSGYVLQKPLTNTYYCHRDGNIQAKNHGNPRSMQVEVRKANYFRKGTEGRGRAENQMLDMAI
jgi:hypothetical protein